MRLEEVRDHRTLNVQPGYYAGIKLKPARGRRTIGEEVEINLVDHQAPMAGVAEKMPPPGRVRLRPAPASRAARGRGRPGFPRYADR